MQSPKEAKTMNVDELRQRYLEFFKSKNHLIYPSAPLDPKDPTLLFTSAGMVQFKPYFLGATPKFAGFDGVHHRVTTAQKCLRVGDVENVGRTLRHHSFFEMMGNFSFGDYFKKEAAQWAWEFLTSPEWMGLEPERLYVTVYTDDDEAFDVWTQHVGVPAERMSRWGEDENFWPANAVSAGPNGPCGPCSEIFYDRGPEYGTPDETGPNTGSGDRFIEIWNLVFTQYDRQEGGELVPLPQKNIDTGLGFERLTAVMSDVEDAYATDLFQPTIQKVAQLSGQPYKGIESTSHRVIADHTRAITFAISEGILPTNDGRGYVIKMLLRRASRHAWLLGLREPVLHTLVEQVVEAMGGAYPELKDAKERVQGIIKTEEAQFLRTLESGIQRVAHLLDELDTGMLPGNVAFDLWETYGFPLDLTEEMAAERGVSVDRAGYQGARERARRVSKSSAQTGALFTASKDTLGKIAGEHGETKFLGYEHTQSDASIIALIIGDEEVNEVQEAQSVQIVLNQTPFYAEGGGQIGDAGVLEWQDKNSGKHGGKAIISTTTKSKEGLFLHQAKILRGTLKPGQEVHAVVDPSRKETEKHHSATHLLHAALRSVLGTHVAQAGSLVAPERLRFDFSHGQPISREEVTKIETLVNRWIQADFKVNWRVVPISEARERGAMMLFGEKYGQEVRMVSMGKAAERSSGLDRSGTGAAGTVQGKPEDASRQQLAVSDAESPNGEGAISIELCGGTHVRRTGEIGSLVITSEEAVSAGVRRLEALTGIAALHYVQSLREGTNAVAQSLGVKSGELAERIHKLQSDLKAAGRESASLRDKLAAAQTSGGAKNEVKGAAGFRYSTLGLENLDATALRNAADTLLTSSGADIVVLASGNLMVAKVSKDAQKRGAHAGNLIREVAKRAGGGGGGRPDLAQAGIKDASQVQGALAAVPEILEEFGK